MLSSLFQYRYDSISDKRCSRKVLDNYATIDFILEHRCSISRYGDGELALAMAYKYGEIFHSGFQLYNEALGKRLVEILDYRDKAPNHLVCLPACAFSYGTGYLRRPAKDFWNKFTWQYIDKLLEMTANGQLYGETNISRLYLSHKDKSRCQDFVNSLKRLWNNRDIVFVEGNLTHLGYGNDLFSNAKSIRRILCPNKNAFDRYNEILEGVISNTTADTLIILALGMTATVLAYDLAKEGRQALDIGHVDIEYEWMRMKATSKVAIPGKFTNEAPGGHDVSESYPEDFKSQIIANIQ